MFRLWESLCMSVCERNSVCVCVCVCVCPSLAWLASSRLERMDHTDGWQRSTTAWLPLFSPSPSLLLLAASSSTPPLSLSSLFFFTSSSFLPPPILYLYFYYFFFVISSVTLHPSSSLYVPDPHGRRAPGCHPLSAFPLSSHALPATDCHLK